MEQEDFHRRVVAVLERWQPEVSDEDKAASAARKARKEADAARIKRVEKVSSAARGNWFWFFGVLAYAMVTVMGLDDRSFFTGGAATKLPILNFSVDFSYFILIAPTLIALVYGYLHNLIEQLWYDLATLPARGEDGQPISAHLPVWLLIDSALILRRWFGDDDAPPVDLSPLSIIGMFGITVLIWGAAPAVVAVFWLKASVLHDMGIQLWIGLALFYCLASAWWSAVSLIGTMITERPAAAAEEA
ncbi:hypothetical protein [Pacificoceanicola onchidii]|uniref:hypothetical protein n=1 Tax=Pacificoceanicola onchidii TaxID=2562685 RepID=UPI0010A4FEE9|nr:hypothetical protein [Pacificoceanicola onchidii]